MNVEYTRRAIVDLRKIAAASRQAFGDRLATALEIRIRTAVAHISSQPFAAPAVEQRRGIRAFLLGRYPFKIFYRVFEDHVLILHIRHTARRPWQEES